MSGKLALALYVLVMVVIIVAVDVTLLRNRFWGRLIVNAAIVLGFAALYMRLFRDG